MKTIQNDNNIIMDLKDNIVVFQNYKVFIEII